MCQKILLQAAGIREPVDDRVIQKIQNLTHQGVRKVRTMRLLLDNFVRTELFQGRPPPPKIRRRYYPARKDISNIMYKAKVAHRFSALHDQDNLAGLIQQWKHDSPTDSFLFRPRADATADEKELSGEDSSSDPGDDHEVPNPQPQGKQHLLFCYQSKSQRRLLE